MKNVFSTYSALGTEPVRDKLQAPSSKLQRISKHQAPNCAKRRLGIKGRFVWDLGLEASLELRQESRVVGLGAWDLELRRQGEAQVSPRNLRQRLAQRRQAGFTLIEIMVVVVVIGILAATIIPQFMGTTHDAKVSTAKSHIAELESALERFYIHMDRRPTTDEGLKALVENPSTEDKKWRGPYVTMIRPDPWGNPYQYKLPGVHNPTRFDLWSRGADNADGGEGDGADIGNWQ